MKVLLSLLCATACCVSPLRAEDWTCAECEEGGAALGDWLASPDNLQFETDILLEALCPSYPEPEFCREKLPWFWGEVGPLIMREHYGQLCSDLDCYRGQARLSVPSCEACTDRIARAADSLGAEETIVMWTSWSGAPASTQRSCRSARTEWSGESLSPSLPSPRLTGAGYRASVRSGLPAHPS